MIYLHHDFYSNFSASASADGNNLSIDLFANELSDLIVDNTNKLVNALNKAGVKVDVSMPDELIVDKTLEGLKDNEKVIKAIGFTIAESNALINTDKGTSVNWNKLIDSFVLGISPAAKEITKNEETMRTSKNKIMQQIVAKANMKGNYDRVIWIPKGSGSGAVLWVLGFIVVATSGYFIYMHYKNKSITQTLPLTPPVPPINPVP